VLWNVRGRESARNVKTAVPEASESLIRKLMMCASTSLQLDGVDRMILQPSNLPHEILIAIVEASTKGLSISSQELGSDQCPEWTVSESPCPRFHIVSATRYRRTGRHSGGD
jgi:hypothetical protein